MIDRRAWKEYKLITSPPRPPDPRRAAGLDEMMYRALAMSETEAQRQRRASQHVPELGAAIARFPFYLEADPLRQAQILRHAAQGRVDRDALRRSLAELGFLETHQRHARPHPMEGPRSLTPLGTPISRSAPPPITEEPESYTEQWRAPPSPSQRQFRSAALAARQARGRTRTGRDLNHHESHEQPR